MSEECVNNGDSLGNMNKQNKEKLEFWMSEYPESFHPHDENRMFDLANSLYESEGGICIDDLFASFIKYHPNYNKEEAMRLCDKWEDQILLIKRFLSWKQKNN